VYELGAIFMNREALDSLPADLKEIFLDAWENDYPTYYLKLMDEGDAEVKKIAQRDCDFHEITPAERRFWYDKASVPMTEWLIKDNNADPEILKKAIDIYQKYW
jgi:TRAP-type C4-dicarboxylate transport system substrate-binding protein